MIVALQMYDWPEVQGRTDAFWSRVRDHLATAGIDAPEALSRPADNHSPWPDPSLLLGQTCGLPYVSGIAGDAVVVGRPCYGLPKASAGAYCSAIICRREDAGGLLDFEGRRAAVNDLFSQSGCNALAAEILAAGHPKGLPFFKSIEISGRHRSSAIWVAEGRADIAAIDSVAWELFQNLEPAHHAKLRVLAWTVAAPALPFITSARNLGLKDVIFQALQGAAKQTKPDETGLPKALVHADDQDYQPIRDMAARTKGMILAKNTHPLGQFGNN